MASLFQSVGAAPTPLRFPRAMALVLWAGLTGSACAQSPDVPANPEAPAPREQEGAGGAPGADIPPVEPLSPEVAACAPPATGAPWAEVARADDGGNMYVLLEHADAGASTDFSLAVVLLAEGGCEHEVVSGPGAGASSAMRRPSDEVWDELVDGSFTWHVNQSGGVEAFADVQRRAHGGTLAECAPGADPDTCVPTWLALRFRRAGVDVAPADG